MSRANPRKPSAPARRAPSPRKGMRLYRMWLPDMDSPAFIRQARRDALAIARSGEEKELLDWADSVSILLQFRERASRAELAPGQWSRPRP